MDIPNYKQTKSHGLFQEPKETPETILRNNRITLLLYVLLQFRNEGFFKWNNILSKVLLCQYLKCPTGFLNKKSILQESE